MKKTLLSLYLVNIGQVQSVGYQYIINNLKNKKIRIKTKMGKIRNMPTFENMESFGYTLLQMPLEALNIIYPIDGLKELVDSQKMAAPIDALLAQ